MSSARRVRWGFVLLAACANSPTAPPAAPARAALCARQGDDPVRDVFCAAQAPRIQSFDALQRSLSLSQAAQYVFLAHSTALSGKLVSSINPRMIALTPEIQLAFTRGVQRVELATRDRNSQRIKLYLLQFEQACNLAADGCSPADLYTPRIESHWTQLTLHDDEDLKNTASDCRQCHQRALAEPMLLMRELEGPWTHFYAPADEDTEPAAFPEPAGRDLFQDYVRAKGDEAYGGVPSTLMGTSIGFTLQTAVSSEQPVLFEGAIIAHERWPYHPPEGYASEAHRSPTWDAQYAAFKRGERLALPYYAARVSDAQKLTQLTAAYRSFQTGELAALPELSDIYPDDAQTRAEIGLQTEPFTPPAPLLIQACAPCHNDVLDQSISRAQFNIALGRLDSSERELAAARIALPANSPGVMPPPDSRQLDENGRTVLRAYLQQATRPQDDDAVLEQAAAVGMAAPPDERRQ